ncbi:NAD-dependent epimerase/dehydratase family protein [Colwellia sp. MB02u-18]|uniref:NAD-dependent epimerase/dehydratase family protein n=1 Tax=unclassified Colwellia TaxID=196834 RepID=UPI0015F5743B|nr:MULTISPECIES: NAD-dependent epimerase/dehydratase family protein [unclassified Colwellia]MBA6222891.1 NAD-dependent epimerase/dehydratase family protein [Colwellia sp. MB3u-45]MBA6267830.1 NAD-dependent epimerase/dehydratase family protein [Colwellia sp. MB3u-43]MBA6322363.1 NAD-dependent epimerase/dehydratase family protein [Colwellia sp. MB02u-19]MBA6324362.1 NAD-dependent epimerase/dehydratase family protein [Colwellia sp. MB02u-18]MBA6332518.1 NAD-dependent epimerase/dehydratase family 
MKNRHILITGGTGFIGRELLTKFNDENITLLSRTTPFKNQIQASLEDFLDKELIIDNFDIVIHLAGLAHNNYDLDEFRKVNVKSTVALAKQVAAKGLKRFVFISSIGVNGNNTVNEPFNELSLANPHADYALSKYEAETELIQLSKSLGFELVIIRPPLVYGENAPGNFKSLYNLISKGVPLPFGLVNNSRSFISVSNLCDFIALTTTHPSAAGELFLIADDERVSTKSLIKTIWKAKNISSFLIPVPTFIFKILFKVLGRSSIYLQLFDNLEVDNSKAKKLLAWYPKQAMIDVFKKS